MKGNAIRLNSVSLNSYKPQTRQNTSFGKYDRKYDWCQENPLISKSHPALYSSENFRLDNLEQIEEIINVREEATDIKRMIEASLSLKSDTTSREIAQRFRLGKLEISKTDDNKVKSYTLVDKDGRKTVAKFGESGEIFVTKGIEDRGAGIVHIGKFYYIHKYFVTPTLIKYTNFLTTGNACRFDTGFTSSDGEGYTFHSGDYNNASAAQRRYRQFQQI